MLEGADVAALPADDPALHVVGRKLDERHRRLGRGAGGNPLERVGDEVARPPLRLAGRLFLEAAHATGELVAYLLLRLLEDLLPRLAPRQLRHPLELPALTVVRVLQRLLELLEVDLPVGDALLAPGELDQAAIGVVLLLQHPLLDLDDLVAPLAQLGLELGPHLDRLLACLDLSFPPGRVGVTLGLVQQERARPPRRVEPRARHEAQRGKCAGDADHETDHDSQRNGHGLSLQALARTALDADRSRTRARGCAPPPSQVRFVSLIGRRLFVRSGWIPVSRRVFDSVGRGNVQAK